MPQALLPLIMNALVAAMFVASFLTIAYLNPAAAKARWLALSYAFGALTPVSELAILHGAWGEPLTMISSGSLLIGLVVMSPALSLFYGKRPMLIVATSIIVAGLSYRWLTWDATRGSFWNEMAFQVFFALASGLCAITVRRHAPRSALNTVLFGIFVLTSLHFLIKPFAASHFGTGSTKQAYAGSLYAVISQMTTGVLLIAGGLILLITVLQSVVQANHALAHSDPLTGLPNRRALQKSFEMIKLQRRGSETPVSIAIVDIDNFKRINDRLGHDVGDDVLRAVATLLDHNRPAIASVARIGGEEFALVLPEQNEQGAFLICDALRLLIAEIRMPGVPQITVSIGVTQALHDELLTDSLRCADRALYQAKRAGRNRCELAGQRVITPLGTENGLNNHTNGPHQSGLARSPLQLNLGNDI
ncbi:GGDEF domain-containing protein (plasmid) [Polymorphobacter sp. PAMC 29334]|uniref:GGDEF domain-containing protein n=1 Tax=Polymorphobacter sp. PAMC 29334 TaxID=2862331 RepID=UPI001C6822B6|nr:GGDEF domain-containing protein [Polymorphobacter sp. PAMC 29334]QYE33120.1 GGDEF domain-containing protein [Polymorphobacter sp. PAMC 29334]